MTSRSNSSIVLTGSSLVCSLGLDAATACAAARAGIVRMTGIDTFIVGTRDDFEGVTVHAAPLITHGFEGDARLLRLLQAAFDGLSMHTRSALKSARAGFYMSLPHPDRRHTGFDLIADEDLRRDEMARWEQIRAARVDPDDGGRRTVSLLDRSSALAGWDQPIDLRAFSMTGHTGVSEMIGAAARDLLAGAVEVAVIGGVDSLVDLTSLRWLEQRGRLKSPTTPAGLAPGEAAGFLVMEPLRQAHGRGAEILSAVQSTNFAREENAHLAGRISAGESLASMLAGTAPRADWSADSSPWLIVDQNGEAYRAHEWGCALTRLVEYHPAFRSPVIWYPVVSMGDTGAATGLVQASTALQAFRRGYAPARQAALLANSDAGHRSVTLLAA